MRSRCWGKRLEFFSATETLFDGLTALPLPGHTPFHTGFLLQDDGESLLNVGDAMIDPRLHVAHPEWTPVGDAQPRIAGNTRRLICDRAVKEGLRLFAYHFPFPGLGRISGDVAENDKQSAETTRKLIFKPDR